ncbi:hypothetical protein [Helicobacter cetorum]|uniref:hypothetical protein n=1 Tax=Helicobacter cetorum TaxID=138563 RepID=UPI000CF12092|nr:hypothetical protein [Helicobacter cetorum]
MFGIDFQALLSPNNVMAQSLLIHIIFASLLVIAFIINLYTLYREKNFIKLNRKIYLVMPAIYILLSIAFLSGIFIWAMQQFEFSWKASLMLVVFLMVLVAEIKRHKSVKFAITREVRMQNYVMKTKILYFIEVLAIVMLMVF